MTASLELYKLHGCPYCRKVESKLQELDLDYETHPVVGQRRNRDEVYEVSGQYGVPVIVDRENGVEGMAESDAIVRYLEREYGDGEPSRSPGLLDRLASISLRRYVRQ